MLVISTTHPISGREVIGLHDRLSQRYQHLNDLDFAFLFNVPPVRIGEIKKAVPGGRENESQQRQSADPSGRKNPRTMSPTHAIMVRLLSKYPELTPLPPQPTSVEVWEAISPYMPKPNGSSRNVPNVNRIGFAPLFGRSYVSSYKLLSEEMHTASTPSANVMRLYVLVMSKFAEILVMTVKDYLAERAPQSLMEELDSRLEPDWTVLRWESDLYRYIPKKADREEVKAVVQERRKAWFDLYLAVLQDEAVSRDLDASEAIAKGNWRNAQPVTDKDMRKYEPRQRPILGRYSPELDDLKEAHRFGLTSSEFYWLLGMQVKAYYRIREKGNQRLDAPTSILLRYLYRQPKDIKHFFAPEMDVQEMLAIIKREDPEFNPMHLGPLLGGSNVVSYHLLQKGNRPFARRLAMIWEREKHRTPDLYWRLRRCVEEEVFARGLDIDEFWERRKWNV